MLANELLSLSTFRFCGKKAAKGDTPSPASCAIYMDLFLLFLLIPSLHPGGKPGEQDTTKRYAEMRSYRPPLPRMKESFLLYSSKARRKDWSQAMYEMDVLEGNGYRSRKVCVLKRL